jgi:REP element-mobilizing transposase RayT
VFVAGAVYHVYGRVARGEGVFADAREAAAFVDVLRAVKREHGLTVLAWCLMSTHYHLAVRTDQVPLWRTMKLIQGRFARSYNRRHRLLGPFWQGRYKAILVPDQRYLEQVIAYVHLNPVTAKVVKDPARYRWSGHRELLGRVGDPLADVNDALALFGARRGPARQAYVTCLRGERKAAWIGERPDRLPWWRGFGDSEAPVALAGGRARVDALGASTMPERVRLSPDDYLARVCRLHDLELADLAGRRKDPKAVQVRELTILVGVEKYGLKIKDLGPRLGMNPGSVSRVLARAGQRVRDEASFRRQRAKLEERLAELR